MMLMTCFSKKIYSVTPRVLHCSFSIATSCVHVSTITFSTQTWLHKGESKHKSLQEVEASFFRYVKDRTFLFRCLGGGCTNGFKISNFIS